MTLHKIDTANMPADLGCAVGDCALESEAYDLRGMDYSDYHGPRIVKRYPAIHPALPKQRGHIKDLARAMLLVIVVMIASAWAVALFA